MAAIISKQKISISPGGRIIHTFSDSGFQEALSGPSLLTGTHASRGGIIIMVPIDQMRILRLRYLIKVTELSTCEATNPG